MKFTRIVNELIFHSNSYLDGNSFDSRPQILKKVPYYRSKMKIFVKRYKRFNFTTSNMAIRKLRRIGRE